MEERTLNEKESLELITRMIQNTQNRLVGSEGIPFLVWGYVTVVVTAAVGVVMSFYENYLWNLLWFAIPICGCLLTMLLKRKTEKGVKTFIDKVVNYIWIVIGIACVVSAALSIFCNLYMHILFLELLLVSIGAVLTGLIIEFKASTIGGIIGMVLAFLVLFISSKGLIPILSVFAVAFIVMMIIPGHVLNHSSRRQTEKGR